MCRCCSGGVFGARVTFCYGVVEEYQKESKAWRMEKQLDGFNLFLIILDSKSRTRVCLLQNFTKDVSPEHET